MTFTRKDDGRKASFDSSPDFTLPKMHGYHPGSVRLERTETTDKAYTYDVYAKSSETAKETKVGVLVQKTRAAVWAEQNR